MIYVVKKWVQFGFELVKDGVEYGLCLKFDENDWFVLLDDYCEVDVLMDLVDVGFVMFWMLKISVSGQFYFWFDGYVLNDLSFLNFLMGYVEWLLMLWVKFGFSELGWIVVVVFWCYKGDGGMYV